MGNYFRPRLDRLPPTAEARTASSPAGFGRPLIEICLDSTSNGRNSDAVLAVIAVVAAS